MTYNTQAKAIQAAIAARQSMVFWGDPGIAKSALVQALGEQMGLVTEVVDLTGKEPGDLVGLPHIVDDDGLGLPAYGPQAMVMAPPSWARRLCAAGEGILLLDEIGSCEPALAAAALGIVNDRRVGELTLPDDVVIILAGNPVTSGANAFEIPAPLANRLFHIDFTSLSAEAWAVGLIAGFDTVTPKLELCPPVDSDAVMAANMKVAGFVQSRPDLLHDLPETADKMAQAWPSHRSWANTAAMLAHVDPRDSETLMGVVSGMVGEGAALEFLTWVAFGDLPRPADVLADPTKLDWSERPDRVFAVLTGVAGYVAADGSAKAWGQAWKVLAGAKKARKLDVAGVTARTLMAHRPPRAKNPAEAAMFGSLLASSGLIAAA